MSIKKKIEIDEAVEVRKREAFISKGGQVSADKKEKGEFSNVLIRMPSSILGTVDHCVKRKPWMTRTQWIMEAIAEKLEKEF